MTRTTNSPARTSAFWRNDYQHDANGNITELATNIWGTLSYGYDALDRLTSENTASKQGSYSYDGVGNRTQREVTENGATATTTYQYASDSNRLTAINGQAVTTDAAGNLTRDRASRLLGYDAQNRLASVKINGQQVAEYRYNSLGQRIAKLTGQGFTTYLYGPDGQLLAETDYNSAGIQQRRQAYLWLDSMPLASVETQGNNSPRVICLHSDHLNTPRLATSATQQIAWQWQSDAFGNGAPNQDPQGSGQQTILNLRFAGQYYDTESGLHYNYFRDYDPETGLYVESDPIGLNGGLNTYGYVGANPVGNIDPLGLQTAILCPRVTIGFEGMTAGCPGSVPRPSPVGGIPNAAANGGGMGLWCLLTGSCAANEQTEPEECPVDGATPQPGKTRGPSTVWEKPGDFGTANGDFDKLPLTDVTDLPTLGGRRGTMPDGSTAVVRPTSSDGRPSIEIQSGRNRIKIRYGQ